MHASPLVKLSRGQRVLMASTRALADLPPAQVFGITLGGPAGVGKSTLGRALTDLFGTPTCFAIDNTIEHTTEGIDHSPALSVAGFESKAVVFDTEGQGLSAVEQDIRILQLVPLLSRVHVQVLHQNLTQADLDRLQVLGQEIFHLRLRLHQGEAPDVALILVLRTDRRLVVNRNGQRVNATIDEVLAERIPHDHPLRTMFSCIRGLLLPNFPGPNLEDASFDARSLPDYWHVVEHLGEMLRDEWGRSGGLLNGREIALSIDEAVRQLNNNEALRVPSIREQLILARARPIVDRAIATLRERFAPFVRDPFLVPDLAHQVAIIRDQTLQELHAELAPYRADRDIAQRLDLVAAELSGVAHDALHDVEGAQSFQTSEVERLFRLSLAELTSAKSSIITALTGVPNEVSSLYGPRAAEVLDQFDRRNEHFTSPAKGSARQELLLMMQSAWRDLHAANEMKHFQAVDAMRRTEGNHISVWVPGPGDLGYGNGDHSGCVNIEAGAEHVFRDLDNVLSISAKLSAGINPGIVSFIPAFDSYSLSRGPGTQQLYSKKSEGPKWWKVEATYNASNRVITVGAMPTEHDESVQRRVTYHSSESAIWQPASCQLCHPSLSLLSRSLSLSLSISLSLLPSSSSSL